MGDIESEVVYRELGPQNMCFFIQKIIFHFRQMCGDMVLLLVFG